MIGCLYISEFPAWALQMERPDRRSIAVYHAGRIIARSRLLCHSGMLLGDPLERARSIFPEASFIPHDAPFEQAVWDGVLQRINEITPFLQSIERGVAFFRPYDFSEACVLAEQLVGRVGLGPDKCIARIAAARSAPGSVLQIRQEAVARFLSRTSTAVLSELGFGEDLVSRLELFGLADLNKVRSLTKQHLRVQFGASGVSLFNLLHPGAAEKLVPAYVPPSAITEAFHFDSGSCDRIQLSRVLDWMVRRAALRLRGTNCTRLALRVHPVENGLAPTLNQRVLKSPTSNSDIIARAADYLLNSALSMPIEVASIALTLAGLQTARRAQASLFFERPPLDAVLQRIGERFPGAIRRALLVRPDAPFPEDSVRLVPFLD